jgi:hypothetical protein
MQCLVLVKVKPIFTLRIINKPVQDHFCQPKHPATCNKEHNTAMYQCVGRHPVIPAWKCAFVLQALCGCVMPVLELGHRIPLKHKVSYCVSNKEFEQQLHYFSPGSGYSLWLPREGQTAIVILRPDLDSEGAGRFFDYNVFASSSRMPA